jgi:4-hydroxybenzoate polyprenyltransferase
MEQSRAMPLSQLRGLVKTMRPHQWIPKNIIVFAALVLSESGFSFSVESILRAVAAFVIFSLISSCAYILNDLLDIEKDRAHPKKKERPLPSGQLAPTTAWAAMVVFLLVSLVSAFMLSPLFALIIALYFINNIIYSTTIKNVVILDVFSISAGFVLRAMGGAVAVGVPISPWLYILTALLALFLGISKRRHELHLLKQGSGAFRKVLDEYSEQMLEEMLNVVTASTVIAYSIYTFTAESLPSNHAMMLTIPFVVYGIFRYLYLVHSGQDAPPDEMLLKDRPLIATVILWGISVMLILYTFGNT